MKNQLSVVQLPDPMNVVLLHKKQDQHDSIARIQRDITPIRQIPDIDVVMNDIWVLTQPASCVHSRRVEKLVDYDEGGSEFETVSCRNEASKDSPNGFLCSYHQRMLAPAANKIVKKPAFYKPETDAAAMLSLLDREVKQARQELTDNELHDHLTFERLQKVQVEEDVMRRYLGR